MSLSWSQLKGFYLEMCEHAASAEQEALLHLTEGYRLVARELDIPELRQPEAAVELTESSPGAADWPSWFLTDCDVYAISSLHNATDGHPMHPEVGGMAGRDRYLVATGDSTSTPDVPAGTPTRWTREGERIYVRDRPEKDTRIVVRFHAQVPEVGSADLSNHPLTPPQYDLAIAKAAAYSWYSSHPQADRPAAEGMPPPSVKLFAEATGLTKAKPPPAIEQRTRVDSTRLAGYRVGPRSVRRG